jgi:chorismate mutase
MQQMDFLRRLEELRREIDVIDVDILHLLAKRFNVVSKVGKLKAEYGLDGSYIRPAREALMLRKLIDDGAKLDIPAELIVILWRQLIGAATAHESPVNLVVLQNDLQASFFAAQYFGEVPKQSVAAFEFWKAGDSHSIFIMPYDLLHNLWQTRPNYLRVFAHIPYIKSNSVDGYLAIANITPESIGDDVYLFADEQKNIYQSDIFNDNHEYIGCFARPLALNF